MPVLWDVLEVGLWEIVSVMAEAASPGYSITTLNSPLKLERGLVDKTLNLHGLNRLTPSQESLWC